MAYTVNPMLIKGKRDKNAGLWGQLIGSLVGGAASAIPGVGPFVGPAAGGMAGGMATRAMDDSTPDRYTQQTPAYAPTQDAAFQALLRRYGLA